MLTTYQNKEGRWQKPQSQCEERIVPQSQLQSSAESGNRDGGFAEVLLHIKLWKRLTIGEKMNFSSKTILERKVFKLWISPTVWRPIHNS